MNIIIAYPPLDSSKGVPLLSQNRQFQYFNAPTYIYPVVPAQAATLLKQAGHDVVWLDGIAEGLTYPEFLEKVKFSNADVIAIETKTPVIKQHWKIINDLKKLATSHQPLITVLFGDHVTALPQESFENSKVDYVLTGGDYDFLLLSLCNALQASLAASHYQLATNLEPGVWYREGSEVKNTGKFQLNHDLNTLPFIDRDLTKWKLYAYKNGNFKHTPGTYIMSGRDCWWGKCKFCSWPTLYPTFRSRSPKNVLDEIEMLIEKYSIKEIMDDTGTLPVGAWLQEFCDGMIKRGLSKKVTFNCNMRFGVLSNKEYEKMKEAGFRLVLFGLESANQGTLNRIDKNVTVEQVIDSCKTARNAGLYPHITIMFGYPWETYQDAIKTLELGRYLLKKGHAYTVQATIVIPYPGSGLFSECQKNHWLKSADWNDYDMRTPVMTTPMSDENMRSLVRGIYSVAFSPEFIIRRLFSMKDISDLTYFTRGFKKVFGHLLDFRK